MRDKSFYQLLEAYSRVSDQPVLESELTDTIDQGLEGEMPLNSDVSIPEPEAPAAEGEPGGKRVHSAKSHLASAKKALEDISEPHLDQISKEEAIKEILELDEVMGHIAMHIQKIKNHFA
jgi:hypothetical protein